MSGFRVALPNPDAVDSWMVKNGLYSLIFIGDLRPLIQQKIDTSREKELSRVLDHMDDPLMGSPV